MQSGYYEEEDTVDEDVRETDLQMKKGEADDI